MQWSINSGNVGRIAERIVANELEYRGFRVSDLNKEGTSANADLLAGREGKTLQVQVKGATNTDEWWVNYGVCTADIIAGKGPMFNRASSFYRAQIVVLVAVKLPKEYRCVIMPAEVAERAAQLSLDCDFRTPTRKGTAKKPHKVWTYLEYCPKTKDAARQGLIEQQLEILKQYTDNWNACSG